MKVITMEEMSMTMIKSEMNGVELAVICRIDFYEATRNGKVFFRHKDYEVVRALVLGV